MRDADCNFAHSGCACTESYLQHLALAQTRVPADQHMDVAPRRHPIRAVGMLAHAPEQRQQQPGFDELMAVDCGAQRMGQVPKLLPSNSCTVGNL